MKVAINSEIFLLLQLIYRNNDFSANIYSLYTRECWQINVFFVHNCYDITKAGKNLNFKDLFYDRKKR